VERGAIAAAVAALAGIGAWLIFRPREASATSPAKPSPAKPSPAKATTASPSAPSAPSTPGAPKPAPATAPVTSSSLPSTGRYETAMDAFGEPDWAKVSTLPGRLVTRLPLLTTGPERAQGVTYARATQDTTRELAKRFGARAPTLAEMDAISKAPEVVIVQMCNQPPTSQMASLEWARKHDECVRSRIGEAPSGPVYFTIGKHWVEPLADAAIYGFFAKAGDPSSIVQRSARTLHRTGPHVDYSQTVFLVKDLEGEA
jgi:hypothetical protein